MSLEKLSQLCPLLKTLSINQVNYRFLNPLKTSSYLLTRNLSIYNLQARKNRSEVVPSPLQYNAYYSLIQTRCQFIRCSSSKQNDTSSESSSSKSSSPESKTTEEKISLFQRMKMLYRDYWYILVPVHVVTSTIWIGSFYYLAKSGVDVVALMQSIGFSEKMTNRLESGNPAYTNLALAYALYKIATPARYTVTLGATTFSINKLKELGYIKPMPPKEKLVEMYEEKKEKLIERKDLLKEKIQDNKALLQERYHDNKAYIQEKYSPEKCKTQLRASRDRLLNSWHRKGSRQNHNKNLAPGKSNGHVVSRTKGETGTDVKKKEKDDFNKR